MHIFTAALLIAAFTAAGQSSRDSLSCPLGILLLEDFGAGASNPGQALPEGTITYCFEDLTGTCPSVSFLTPGSINDGSYSIMNDPHSGLIFASGDTIAWISVEDHTPGDTGGYMLVVNADIEPGEFYRLNNIPVNAGETYSFSAWFINVIAHEAVFVCTGDEVPVNVRFEVEESATGSILGSITTGDIFSSPDPQWIPQEFLFTAEAGLINIVLSNNGPGGCGNDFAIDDISLRGCVANTTLAEPDAFGMYGCDSLVGNITENDFDPEGDDQILSAFYYDGNGNGIRETEGTFGAAQVTAGTDAGGSVYFPAAEFVLFPDGSLRFRAVPSFGGMVRFSYVICDTGIPSVCDTADVLIDVNACLEDCIVPDLISPNGDGFNDHMAIECPSGYPEIQLSVYNRWGNQVFDSGPGYDNSWAGTYGPKGKELPEGVYFYILDFHHPDRPAQAGDLLILR